MYTGSGSVTAVLGCRRGKTAPLESPEPIGTFGFYHGKRIEGVLVLPPGEYLPSRAE
jgi:hypothetical protein